MFVLHQKHSPVDTSQVVEEDEATVQEQIGSSVLFKQVLDFEQK